MRIAYISFEHPFGIAGGGIGTYVGQVAKLMTERGHEVEVFTGHQNVTETIIVDGYVLHRIHAKNVAAFRIAVAEAFKIIHIAQPFDVMEAAEFGADALHVKHQFPHLPLALKLHTPSYLIHQLNFQEPSLKTKTRFIMGGLLRGQLSKPYWQQTSVTDLEQELYHLADAVCSPSASLAAIVEQAWGENEVEVIPNVFEPSASLLTIAPQQSNQPVVSYFGKLEKRKGVLDLADAIPMVLRQNPEVQFRFVGSAHTSPRHGMDMATFIQSKLGNWNKNVSFLGFQPYDAIPNLLAQSTVCVFPSLWENFPNVCLEAMSAGRAVVATHSGGMADMVVQKKCGLLVPPNNPYALAEAMLSLATNREAVRSLGAAARERVLTEYNGVKVGQMIESFYQTAISNCLGQNQTKNLSQMQGVPALFYKKNNPYAS